MRREEDLTEEERARLDVIGTMLGYDWNYSGRKDYTGIKYFLGAVAFSIVLLAILLAPLWA